MERLVLARKKEASRSLKHKQNKEGAISPSLPSMFDHPVITGYYNFPFLWIHDLSTWHGNRWRPRVVDTASSMPCHISVFVVCFPRPRKPIFGNGQLPFNVASFSGCLGGIIVDDLSSPYHYLRSELAENRPCCYH